MMIGKIFIHIFQILLVFFKKFVIIASHRWLGGRVVMQRTATPCTPVRFRPQPPSNHARVVKLVDTRDLKSLARNSVPVQVRPRAPYIKTYLIGLFCCLN